MSKQEIEQLIKTSFTTLKDSGKLISDFPTFLIDKTKDKVHGDFASNIALILAKPEQKKPREIAELILSALPTSALVSKVEIAGPGFINFFVTSNALYHTITDILAKKEKFGQHDIGKQKKIHIEFLSSNPTGPLHVGHGRHAAFGAVIADLLEAVGYEVHREYYVNDAGRQMDILAVSVWLRYLGLLGESFTFPANAYKGDYVLDIAAELKEKNKNDFFKNTNTIFANLPKDEPEGGDKEIYIDHVIKRAKEILGEKEFVKILNFTLENILKDIREDLASFGVNYQTWFSERKFVEGSVVNDNIQKLKDKNLLYERDGALWFRSTDFNDEKDRVMVRANGQRTYFANDFAYHINKFERGFEHAIDIFGSDHHGYIPRMKAGLTARNIQPDKLTYLLVQFVSLFRAGEQVSMSTRSGSFVTLRELREEVGNDAARFFYVMRKAEQHMDFDLDLAKSQSNDNPVYYIQYAHARICSVFRQLNEKQLTFVESTDFSSLKESHEFTLLSTLSRYPEIILNAATRYEPHLLTNYLKELANDFHSYYNSHQFIVEDEKLRNARLTLIAATKQVIVNGLKILGVSTPETM